MKINVILPTYNGKKYLNDQIDSIINQNIDNSDCIELLISDDGSSDNTVSLLEAYKHKSIKIVNTKRLGGVINNVKFLLSIADGDVIFLADQDDIWIENRIKKYISLYNKIKNRENLPILIYSDSLVVNEKCEIINKSFIRSNKKSLGKNISFVNVIFDSLCQGAVMMINKNMNNNIVWPEKNIIMHDWWICLYASYIGRVYYIDEQTILYRQHDSNQIGSVKKRKIIRIAMDNYKKYMSGETLKDEVAQFMEFKNIIPYKEKNLDFCYKLLFGKTSDRIECIKIDGPKKIGMFRTLLLWINILIR